MKNICISLVLLYSAVFSAQQIVLEEFASGFNSPVEIVNAKDSRLFVVQQNGLIKVLNSNGSVNSQNFLDISSKITFNGERGLLGLAFHPQFSGNGYFYVFYNSTSGNIVVSQYSVSSSNPNVANASSEKILLNIPKPFTNHNGGTIHFGPDNYLWISTGDGGSGGDPNNNAQNKNSLLGKILRIDVNSTDSYAIPSTNPFVNTDGLDEIWAYGLRNAWKFSFDYDLNNVLIADVGQGLYEEINKMPAFQGGINYGWRCYEGNSVYNAVGCASASTMTFPVSVYDHSGGKCSITGGYVYRGTAYNDLKGSYLFADYCSTQIGILNSNNQIVWSSAFSGNNFSTFGEDVNKELYVAAVNSGKIFKVKTTNLAATETMKSKLSIYPNPTSDYFFIEGLKGEGISVELISIDGKLISKDVSNTKSIDVKNLPSGVYFVTVKQNGQKVFSQKIIKK